MNTVINTVSEKAFNEILRNNNKACYIKGYADGYLVGGLVGVGTTISMMVLAGLVYKLGKKSASKPEEEEE